MENQLVGYLENGSEVYVKDQDGEAVYYIVLFNEEGESYESVVEKSDILDENPLASSDDENAENG